ncbi:hypothetical protein LA080_001363 [Diaporthe eres]|uniref:Uncharacterized protein n=1 Tax=Diaporthe vaccinii TaxID=105482 RepID=A0ABR4DXD8_9PEZI|nr:hypothetical protein LA080_001363 [Diaporthe eres]
MSKNYQYSQAEDNYIRDKLDELAKAGRLLESTDDVFDYLDELGLGTAFCDYFESMPRAERKKIVEEHKQKYRNYQARPGLATAAARGPPPSDSAYESTGRVSGPPGIERLRQADEYSDYVNNSFEISLVYRNEEGEAVKAMRARYDDRNSANFMCLTTAQKLWGPTLTSGQEIPIRWRRSKDDPKTRHTRCHLRELIEDENQEVNIVFGSEVSRPGSTIATDPPAIEDPELEACRASLRAKNAAMLVDQLTELDMQKLRQKRTSR